MSCLLVESTKLKLQICYFHVQFSKLVGKIQGLFKHFQKPYLFPSTFKGLEFLKLHSTLSMISRARYEPCTMIGNSNISRLYNTTMWLGLSCKILCVYKFIFIMLHIWSALIRPEGIPQFYLPPTYKPSAFTPQLQGVTTLCLVLIVPTHKGMARSSWPGQMAKYQDKSNVLHRELNRDMVSHPSTIRVKHRLTLMIKTNMLPLCQTTIV